jgi:glutathione S-transferase
MSLWADRLLFLPVVAVVFAEIGAMVPQAFIDDRSRMMPGRNFADLPRQAPYARDQVRGLVATLEAQLADGRPFLLGDAFSLADASSFHPLWFLRMAPTEVRLLDAFPRTLAWMARLDAMGQGDRQELPRADALALAREATTMRGSGVDAGEPGGLVAGMRVTATPDDYAFDPVEGEVVGADALGIALRRTDPHVGEVVVHFPRVGFRVVPTT